MFNSDELIVATAWLTVWKMHRINRCRYKRVRINFVFSIQRSNVIYFIKPFFKCSSVILKSYSTNSSFNFGIAALLLSTHVITYKFPSCEIPTDVKSNKYLCVGHQMSYCYTDRYWLVSNVRERDLK